MSGYRPGGFNISGLPNVPSPSSWQAQTLDVRHADRGLYGQLTGEVQRTAARHQILDGVAGAAENALSAYTPKRW